MAQTNLAIRQVGPAIVAIFAGDEAGNDGVVIATMRTVVADVYPEAFDKFKAFATDLARMMLESEGIEIQGVTEERISMRPQ